MLRELRPSLSLLVLFLGLTGFGYPLLVMKTGQSLFPSQANGSLIKQDGKIIGSTLIGQNFSTDPYFHSRPSAAGQGYDAANSSGSNAAITSADFLKAVTDRVAELRHDTNGSRIPIDLVTTSASGLDPDISVDAALFQIGRIAEARHISVQQIEELIKKSTIKPQLGFIGPQRVNVLEINRKLDQIAPLNKP